MSQNTARVQLHVESYLLSLYAFTQRMPDHKEHIVHDRFTDRDGRLIITQNAMSTLMSNCIRFIQNSVWTRIAIQVIQRRCSGPK